MVTLATKKELFGPFAPKVLSAPLPYNPQLHRANGFQPRHADQDIERKFRPSSDAVNHDPLLGPVTLVMLDSKGRIRAYINFMAEKLKTSADEVAIFVTNVAVDKRYSKQGYPERLFNSAHDYSAEFAEAAGKSVREFSLLCYGRLVDYFGRMGFVREKTEHALLYMRRGLTTEPILPIKWGNENNRASLGEAAPG